MTTGTPTLQHEIAPLPRLPALLLQVLNAVAGAALLSAAIACAAAGMWPLHGLVF